MSDLLTYAYAVARAADGLDEAATALDGVAGAPVRLLPSAHDDTLLLVTGQVPAEDFREDALARHLEDLDWLETVARAHHQVIETLGARTTVLPLRLATVYLDDARARDVLDEGRELFASRLDRLVGHVEWGVKIYADPASAAPEPDAGSAAELTPGRSYLRGRRRQQTHRDSVHRAAQQAAAAVEETGRRYAVERARHRVQQGALAGGAGENVVNDAYLVAGEDSEAFRAEAGRAAEGLPGVRVEVTGPWVPYSFATPATGHEGAPTGAAP
ncbi:GvpL/GvpF family gas vesicle protein [Streptomyces sp. NPDC091385]|uniref:GvpL/GvpF family gas vesicle protein n=1 Tax=Streptomyces sp. NPDC091385 TaxID=3365997 RepID=UPI003825E505